VASWALIDAMPERFSCFAPMSAGPPQTFVNCTDLRQRELSWYILFFQMQGVAEESLMADDWRLYRDLFRSHPDLEEVIEQMSKPGALTAGLNWYRANFPWLSNAGELQAFAPTMGFWSDGDHFLTEELMIGAGRYVTGCWDYQRLRGASHWLMQDDRVNRLLLNFLASHHPV
jgi:hypothetical protein